MTDYHVHTSFCDGADDAETVVLSAIEKGVEILGFSGHSYNPFDVGYCMEKDTSAYRAEIERLKKKYKDKIKILCGIEQDITSGTPEKVFDYVIGSVHHVVCNGENIPVDNTKELLQSGICRHFKGDVYSFCERYYEDVASLSRTVKPDIIGHFDLVTKFTEKGFLLDEENPRYVAAYTKAAEKLVLLNVPFEINTGAISRGYRSAPYPSLSQMKKIAELGGKFILTSDCHSAKTVCFEFEKWRKVARDMGLCVIDRLPV